MAANGKNPYNTPEFQKRYNDILYQAKQSKDLEQNVSKLASLVAGDHDNRFTEDSKLAANNYVQGVLTDPAKYLGKPAPQLQGTPSGIEDFNKTINPVTVKNGDGSISTTEPDVGAMMAQAYQNANDPRWNNIKSTKYGIDNNLGDIGSIYVDKTTGRPITSSDPAQLKNAGRMWTTTPAGTEHIAQTILDNPTEPRNVDILAKLNVTLDDPYALQKVQAAVANQNTGYGKFMTDAGNYGKSLISTSRDVTPAFTPYQLFEMNWKKNHPNGDKVPDKPTYFQDLSERMRTGVSGSGEEFNQQVANNPAYLHGIGIDNSDPKSVVITVPAKMKDSAVDVTDPATGNITKKQERVVAQPSYKVTLDSTDPQQWTAGFAKIYKDLTGDATASPSRALTTSGKGKVAGGLSPVGKQSTQPNMPKQISTKKEMQALLKGAQFMVNGVLYTKK